MEQVHASSAKRVASCREWVLTRWPLVASMLVASVIFAGAVHMYPTIPLNSDAISYSDSAHRIVQKGVLHYGSPNAEGEFAGNAIVTPVYPLFLSGFYLFAPHGASLEDSARAVHPAVLAAQLVLAVLTVGLIAAIGAELAGSGLAFMSGMLAALYLPFAWTSSIALSETLGTLLICLQLLLAVKVARREHSSRIVLPMSYGVVSALVVLIRPVFVLWCVIPFVYLLIARRSSLSVIVRYAAVASLSFVLVMTPWWVRNVTTLHEFILLRSDSGTPLLDGTTGGRTLTSAERKIFDEALAKGRDAAGAVAQTRLRAEWEAGRQAFLKKRVDFAFKVVALPYMASQKREDVTGARLPEPSVRFNTLREAAPEDVVALELWTAKYHRVLILLAAVGVPFAWRWPRLLIMTSLPVYTILVHSTILFQSRYFFPAMPAVILMAGSATWGAGLLVANTTAAFLRRRGGPHVGSRASEQSEMSLPAWMRRGRVARKRALFLVLAAGVTLVVVKIAAVPSDILVIDMGSDRAAAGFVEHEGGLALKGSRLQEMTPESVTYVGSRTSEMTVTLTPVGRVNPKARGSEVWLRSASSPSETLDVAGLANMPSSWRQSGAFVMNATGDATPLQLLMETNGQVDLEFTSHPWSGGVRIDSGDYSRVVDLYAADSATKKIRVLGPTNLGQLQRVEMAVPRTATKVDLEFNGPRLVVLHSARLLRAQPWQWHPGSTEGLSLGPGVEDSGSGGGGTALKIPEPSGRLSFDGIRSTPLPWLHWSDPFFLLGLVIVYLGAYQELRLISSRRRTAGLRPSDSPG